MRSLPKKKKDLPERFTVRDAKKNFVENIINNNKIHNTLDVNALEIGGWLGKLLDH